MIEISNEIEQKKQETRKLEHENVSLNEDFKMINQKNKEKEDIISSCQKEINKG